MEKISKIKVGIQGGAASFHEIASLFHIGNDCENIPFQTFEQLVNSVEKGELHAGLMAIENTVAGSLLPNYALLKGKKVQIIGEILLHIEQNLMALPGQNIEDIHEVYSHPMALQQSAKFFKQYPHIKLIEADDTANSAMRIAKNKLKNTGAIASMRAAELFELEVLAKSIETNKRNFTRFLILSNNEEIIKRHYDKEGLNKASISFSLPHEQGSLSGILSIFSFYHLNLTKIQSIPVIGKEWEYHFIVDLTFENQKIFKQSLDAIKPLISELQIYGIYHKAEKSYHSNNLKTRALETVN
ncbi:MAG: prephenate dehydratase [Bacteroidales bacterium]|nr:prephenate dehydratase [Bacteroidales bacterium]